MPIDPKMTLGFVDCESTGLTEDDHVIEIAVARVHPVTLRIEESAHQYVWPRRPIHPDAQRVNGYSEEVWRDRGAISIRQALARTLPLLTGTIPTGQNPEFDIRLLKAAHRNAGRMREDRSVPEVCPYPEHDYHRLDIASLVWPLVVAGKLPGMSLRHSRKLFGLEGEQSHTAMRDVLDALHVYGAVMRLYSNAAEMVHERMLDWVTEDRKKRA